MLYLRWKVGELGKQVEARKQIYLEMFFAHSYILQPTPHTLADMCKSGKATPVRIIDVAPAMFKYVLYFCYGGNIAEEEMEANTKETIHATNIFGIVSLELAAKASYVKKNTTFSEICCEGTCLC